MPGHQQVVEPPATCNQPCFQATNRSSPGRSDILKQMVMENAVIIFSNKGCCMSVVVTRLLQALGVNPAVLEVDGEMECQVVAELERLVADDGSNKDGGSKGGDSDCVGSLSFPAVFVGGRFFGGVERVLATHVAGDLVPILKDAGAFWI